MHLFGIEALSFSWDRYLLIDSIITIVVIAVCVPVFIAVSASRVYTGILLGLVVIFFFKLWRFLPSHRRWVEHQAEKKAERLVAEWRSARPTTQVLYTPTAVTGVAEMSAFYTPSTLVSPTASGAVPQYGGGYYYTRDANHSPFCSPPSPMLTPTGVAGQSLPRSLPPPSPSSPPPASQLLLGYRSEEERRNELMKQRQFMQPSRQPSAPVDLVASSAAAESTSQRSTPSQRRSPSPFPQPVARPPESSPYLLLPPSPPAATSRASQRTAMEPFHEDPQGSYLPLRHEDDVWCLPDARQPSHPSPLPPPPAQYARSHSAASYETVTHAPRQPSISHEPLYIVPPYSQAGSARSASSSPRSARRERNAGRSPLPHRSPSRASSSSSWHTSRPRHPSERTRHHSRRPRHHSRRRTYVRDNVVSGQRGSASQTSTSSYSVDSASYAPSRASPVWQSARYSANVRSASPRAFPTSYG